MNIQNFGLELEFFVKPIGSDQFVLAGDLPRDSCGYLAEARGSCHETPLGAIYLLEAAKEALQRNAAKLGLQLCLQNTADIPREQLRIWLRKFGKSSCNSYFMGGRVYMNNNPRAGLHVHFGNTFRDEHKVIRAGILNIPRIVRIMDQEFADEIKAAKRIPGEYEIKPHGFEYRSLPAQTGMLKLERVLQKILED